MFKITYYENIKKITRICMPTGAIGDFYSYDDIVWNRQVGKMG